MFKYIDITFDYKELQSIKECLEKQISELEKQTKQNYEAINEHKQVLKKINNSIYQVLNLNENVKDNHE
ncbi:MAG: hypothetical protein RBR23_10040 [Arcobacteraceae bacterium]|jgi:hypothetical protein|nr:hypothetical protein [Arcobacteraceae bacterium]